MPLPCIIFQVKTSPTTCAKTSLDGSGHQTVRQLTPQLVPVFEKVLSPTEEELDQETRGKLVELVRYIHKQEPGLVVGREGLMKAIGS